MIESIKQGAEKAVEDSVSAMTALVRDFARSTGWPSDAARSLKVQYSDGQVEVKSSSEKAADLEYGDGESVPSPAVRQFANRLEEAEKVILQKASARLKGVL